MHSGTSGNAGANSVPGKFTSCRGTCGTSRPTNCVLAGKLVTVASTYCSPPESGDGAGYVRFHLHFSSACACFAQVLALHLDQARRGGECRHVGHGVVDVAPEKCAPGTQPVVPGIVTGPCLPPAPVNCSATRALCWPGQGIPLAEGPVELVQKWAREKLDRWRRGTPDCL